MSLPDVILKLTCKYLNDTSLLIDWRPGPVQNFMVVNDANMPSANLSWSPPNNIETKHLVGYEVRFKTDVDRYKSKTVCGTSVKLVCDSGLEPLMKNIFEVRACTTRNKGTWTTKEHFIGTRIILYRG